MDKDERRDGKWTGAEEQEETRANNGEMEEGRREPERGDDERENDRQTHRCRWMEMTKKGRESKIQPRQKTDGK